MALDEEYLKRLKVIFNRGYKKSKKYTAQKINLISSVKETYDRINQTLTGSDLGDSVEKVFEIILKEHWFHDYDSFRENFNPFLKHKLTNKEWEFLWILYNKDFKKFQKNLLVQLLQLLDKQHTFFVNMATFLHKLTIKLGTQPVQNRQIKQFLFFVNSIWVDILNIKGIQDKQMRALMKGDVQNLLSESSNENVINAEIGDKADKFFGIKKELQKPQNVSRRTFIQQTAAVGLAAIFFSGRKALASTDSQEQDNTYSSGSKTAAHELLEMESKQFGISKSAAVEILNSIIDEAKKQLFRLRDTYNKQFKDFSEPEAIGALRTMDRVLKEKGFVRLARAASEQLSYALEHKEVDCDDVTIIYASIAEIMDLPLFAVVLPSHAFLRWQLNNGNSFNWEALLHGEPETDEVTLKGYPVSKYSVENGSYFKSLTRRELTGYCYYKISNSWNAKIYVANKQLSPNFREFALKSIENNTKSIEFNAKVPQMYLNRGHTLSILGDLKGSLRDYEEAKKLDPHDPVTYLLIANISIEESKSSNDVGACYQKAIDNTNQVIDLKDQGIHVDDRIMFWNYDLRCKIWDKKGELDQHAKDQKMKEFYHQKVIEYMRMINDYNRNQRGG